jgi:hypothetical protein
VRAASKKHVPPHGIDGEAVISDEFLRDYTAAENAVNESKSLTPFLELLKRYNKPDELAAREPSLGATYGQRTAFVDLAKAATHLTQSPRAKLER